MFALFSLPVLEAMKAEADPLEVLPVFLKYIIMPVLSRLFISAGIISALLITCLYKRDKSRVTREKYVNGKIYQLNTKRVRRAEKGLYARFAFLLIFQLDTVQ